MKIVKKITLLALVILSFAACKEEPVLESATFTVTVQNVFEAKSYLATGTTDFLAPGESQTITFNAGKGTYLNFATMFVQSNDLFYGFDDTGLALYDGDGNAVTGDVTSSVSLWDAGTEVNEMPGTGPNQAPRQSGANTGMDENGTVQIVNDGFTYPTTNSVIKVSLAHDGGTQFTLTLENVSGSATLATPLAPGVWGVHGSDVKLFTNGMEATPGMEAIAEDGDNSTMSTSISGNTGYVSPFAPGVFAVHNEGVMPIFTNGTADRGEGLEALAEDGDPSALNTAVGALTGVTTNGVFNTPDGASAAGPLLPWETYTFTFEAKDGDYLSLATMLVHTNDLFYGFGDGGIALFNNGTAVTGDVTGELQLWDAGTEVNEYPGAGNNQPARGGADSGASESENVMVVNDAFTYPNAANAIKVTISAQ